MSETVSPSFYYSWKSSIFAGDWLGPVSRARSGINRLRRGSLIIIHCSINWDLCLLWKLLTCKEAKSGQTSSQVCLQHVTPARILTAKNWITPSHNLTNSVKMNQQVAQEGLHVISGSMQPTECCCFVLLCCVIILRECLYWILEFVSRLSPVLSH